MGEKRRRKALTSIRRKPKLRRKSVKVERTITRKGTHGNARCTIRERKKAASYPIGIQQKKILVGGTG